MPTKRKPVAKKKTAVVKKKVEAPRTLGSYTIEELIAWRNSARKRIREKNDEIAAIVKESVVLFRKFLKAHKKANSDAAWEKKLNRVIARKVF